MKDEIGISYIKMLQLYEDISVASSISSLLYWDIETNKMPSQGVDHRSKQFSYLTKQQQEVWNSESMATHLNKLMKAREADPNQFSDIERRNIKIMMRKFQTKTKIDTDLIMKLSAKSNTTNQIWKKAKEQNNFEIVQQDMAELFELNLQYAQQLADIKNIDDPFTALIDERDEGMTAPKIKTYFNKAKSFLVPLLKKTARPIDAIDDKISSIKLTRQEQIELSEIIADIFQYPHREPNARGSIDEVEHPLTITCGPNDARITVKYGNYLNVINATNHELGHGIHNLGKNLDWKYHPINSHGGPSLGECISRYTENKIGKSLAFHNYLYPKLRDLVGSEFNDISAEEFFRSITRVSPGTSRMHADEVSYGLHIIIRFEIEEMLFNDKAEIGDVKELWNQKYEDYLGVEIESDQDGILQDLHWYNTYWGYFHGYFMGDLLGSQLHAKMVQDLPSWGDQLQSGDLSDVLHWHEKNVFNQGARYPTLGLLEKVTGEPLDPFQHKSYLENKYLN